MSQSTSPSELKFLLDENVRSELEPFLRSKGFNVISPKNVVNGRLAELSKTEKRVLVTNDSDFSDPVLFPREKIFSVIWLKIPQNNPRSLLRSFSGMLKDMPKSSDFKGYLVVLKEDGHRAEPILSKSNL